MSEGMTKEIALHCMKSASELESELCEECPIYGQTGCDHCYEDALHYVIAMLEQEPVLNKIRAEIDEARFIDKDTKLCKNANASGLEVAMQIIDKYRGGEQ